eukprot:793633-Rhodomonas_salina.1
MHRRMHCRGEIKDIHPPSPYSLYRECGSMRLIATDLVHQPFHRSYQPRLVAPYARSVPTGSTIR